MVDSSAPRNIIQNLVVLKTVLFSVCPGGVSVLPLTETEKSMLFGSVLLLFSPWFGFYSRHLSVRSLKASLVSKGRDERKMTWLCSLPKHALWDTNQGCQYDRKLPAEVWRAWAEFSASLPFSSLHLFPPWCEDSLLCVWLPLSVCGLDGGVAVECVVMSPTALSYL